MTASGPDFLSLIAAKAVGAAPLVEPRLPARFEARREGAGEVPRIWEDPVEVAVDVDVARPASPPRRPPVETLANDMRPVAPEAADPGNDAQPPRARGAETPAPPAAAPRRSAPAQAQPAASARVQAPPAVAAPSPPLLVPPAEAKATYRSEKPVADRPAFQPAVPAVRVQDRVSRPAAEAVASDAAAQPAPFEAPVPASQVRERARDPAVSLAELRPRPTRGEHRAAERSPPTPVVNITIGRVEVRATAAAPAPPARPVQPPRTAPQSLADYLKRRDAR